MSSESTQTAQEDDDRLGRRPDRDRLADGGPRHAGGVDLAEHDPPRSGRLDRGPRVDGQRLQPELRGPADHSRRARRSLRAPGLLRDRAGPVRRGLGGGRARAQRRLPRRGPGSPGGRRGAGADAGADAADRCVPAREARRGDRPVQRGHRDRGRARPAGRRRDRRGHRLDVDLLAQRADRPGRDPARAEEDRGELRRRHRSRHPRPGADQRRRLRARLGPGARELRRLGQPRDHRSARGRRGAGGSVHRLGAAGGGADGADALLPLPRVLGGQRGDLLHPRFAVRRRLLLRADAADGAQLRTARRGPAADALDRHLHHRRPGRRQPGGPRRRASVHGRRAVAAGGRRWDGSR